MCMSSRPAWAKKKKKTSKQIYMCLCVHMHMGVCVCMCVCVNHLVGSHHLKQKLKISLRSDLDSAIKDTIKYYQCLSCRGYRKLLV